MLTLDTNVLSELMRPRPDAHVLDWARAQSGKEVYTTAINEAEMLHGLELLPEGKRRDARRAEIHSTSQQDLAGQVLGFDSQAARIYAHIAASHRRVGKPISYVDVRSRRS